MPTIEALCQLVGCELRGSPDVEITGVASLESAGSGDLAPIDSSRYLELAPASRAGAFLVAGHLRAPSDRPCLISEVPGTDLNRIIEALKLAPPRPHPGIHPTAVVDEGAEIGPDLHAGPYAVVEEGARLGARCILRAHVYIEGTAVLGDDCVVEPGAVIYAGAEIGHRVHIGANAVVSRQGFGYAVGPRGPEQRHHIGKVVLEDDVHLGAGTMIDRARFDETRIGRFSKLDNLIQIGHNSSVGQRTFIAAQTGLAGEARIGDDCEIGGQVGIGNRCGTGDRCRVGGKSGFFRMFGDDLALLGYPATLAFKFLRQQVVLQRLASKKGDGRWADDSRDLEGD